MKKLGVFDPYSYDINELILRRKLLKEEGGNDFFSAIYNAEQVGKAIPITLYNVYEQYTNKYGFKSAFFIGLGYLKLYVEELFEPGTLLEALTMTGKIFAKSAKSFKAFKGKSIDEVIGGVAIRKLDDLLSEYPNFNKFKSLDEVAQARISKELEEIGQTEGKLAALNDDLGLENVGDDLVRFFGKETDGLKGWKILSDVGETNLVNRIDDLDLVSNYFKNNQNKTIDDLAGEMYPPTKAHVVSKINPG